MKESFRLKSKFGTGFSFLRSKYLVLCLKGVNSIWFFRRNCQSRHIFTRKANLSLKLDLFICITHFNTAYGPPCFFFWWILIYICAELIISGREVLIADRTNKADTSIGLFGLKTPVMSRHRFCFGFFLLLIFVRFRFIFELAV